MAKAPALVISRGEIHRRTGLSMAHVSKIYGGTRRPSIDALQLIAAAQGLTMDAARQQIASIARKSIAERRRRNRRAA